MATTKKAAPKKRVANGTSDKRIKAAPSPDIFDADVKTKVERDEDGKKVVDAKTAEGLAEMLGCKSESPIPAYDQDAYLLSQANQQIRNLKERNKLQSARLDMFDKVYTLFSADNGRDRCCQSEDSGLEWQIERRLEEKTGKGFKQL